MAHPFPEHGTETMLASILYRLAIILATCLLPISETSVAADPESHLVEMNSRVFDLSVDPAGLRRDADFIPLNRIPWLEDFLEEDPFLGRLVIQIKIGNIPVQYLFDFPGAGSVYKHSVSLPRSLTLDGYDVKSSVAGSRARLLYVPRSKDELFSAYCALDTLSYPPKFGH